MTFNSQDELLDYWSKQPHHQGKVFIRDGIVDPIRWNKARIRLLFLLKEAYSKEADAVNWDLRSHIRDGDWKKDRGNLYINAARWAYAVQHLEDKTAPWFPIKNRFDDAVESMLSSAFVNVKKSSGTSSSDMEQIKKYALIDSELLKQQVDLINPQLIICGNTWESVKHLWPSEEPLYDYIWRYSSFLFVDFWHPSNRYPMQLNYHALTNLLRSSNVLKYVGAG